MHFNAKSGSPPICPRVFSPTPPRISGPSAFSPDTGQAPARRDPSSSGGVRGPAAPRPSAGTGGPRLHRESAALGDAQRGPCTPAAHRATGEPGPGATNPLPVAPLPLPQPPGAAASPMGPAAPASFPPPFSSRRLLTGACAGRGGAQQRFPGGARRQRLRRRTAGPVAARLGPASPTRAARPLSPAARPPLRPALTRKNPASILPPPPPPGRRALPSRRAPRAREPPRTRAAGGAEPGAPQRLSGACPLAGRRGGGSVRARGTANQKARRSVGAEGGGCHGNPPLARGWPGAREWRRVRGA